MLLLMLAPPHRGLSCGWCLIVDSWLITIHISITIIPTSLEWSLQKVWPHSPCVNGVIKSLAFCIVLNVMTIIVPHAAKPFIPSPCPATAIAIMYWWWKLKFIHLELIWLCKRQKERWCWFNSEQEYVDGSCCTIELGISYFHVISHRWSSSPSPSSIPSYQQSLVDSLQHQAISIGDAIENVKRVTKNDQAMYVLNVFMFSLLLLFAKLFISFPLPTYISQFRS